jgi:hypothetical protein
MSSCSSCGARVEWVTTDAGKKMPLDLEPSAAGNVVVRGDGVARTLGPLELAMLPTGTVRRVSHFATCPNAEQHRRPPARGRR